MQSRSSGEVGQELHFQTPLTLHDASGSKDPVSALTAIVSDLGITGATISDYSCMAVARARAEEAVRPDGILKDTFARPLLGANGMALTDILGSHILPDANMIVLRHRLFDDAVSAAPPSIRQAVILGAGLDSRAFRLQRLAGCRVLFEVEGNADIAALKAQRLADLGAMPLCTQRHAIVADVAGDDWHCEIVRLGFDAAEPTLWVLEGLLSYLSADAEGRLLQRIDRLSAPGSQLVGDTWGLGQFKIGLSATGGGGNSDVDDGGVAGDRPINVTSSTTVDQERKGLRGLVGWHGEALLVRDPYAVCTGTRWDEVARQRFMLKKEEAALGPWRMELLTKVVIAGAMEE
ncbi:S-adenosyl-L-methionine-dependent methyltransferase [Zopfochytrium polystomum]|nr:S-adenosyl-L-methionine-dependent methyltransferase [Zopfochytrium polystomum]